MDNDYFINTGISPWSELNCASDQSFFEPNSDQFSNFDSSICSGLSNDVFALRELIGKLGGAIGSSTTTFPTESPNFTNSINDCSSSLTSPKLNLTTLNQTSISNLGNPVPPLPSLAADPGFAERAAKFSCFGSRSFNGRPSQLGVNSRGELGIRSNSPLMGNGKLSRVSSSPALKQDGSLNKQMEIPRPGNDNYNNNGVVLGSKMKFSKLSGSNANSSSNEESSVSEQIPSGETGSKVSNEMNSRKRKVGSRGKSKEDGSNLAKRVEGVENENAKRSKTRESGKIETKTEDETKGGSNDESEKQKSNEKAAEPPKDYIHVRARRGQATDSHSLAERVRREKISERMKLLQDIVPGCNKVTGKALMLDEIINYVQLLQRQVEFLSMKLASVNPSLDVNMENLISKDMFQQNAITLPQQIYPFDPSSPAAFYHQQNVQQLQHNSTDISGDPLSQCPGDPLSLDIRNLGIHLPSVNGFNETLHQQFPSFSEDDLQSMIQMGFVQNPIGFPGKITEKPFME
ncbi:hypothetical protein CASFOL_040301 [Castilleja foliolosa]|uniref:BHLH domain-containing protein n=1 Tax=Castilleja foliolosa TaxID=1961234 RepID=A0ABD3BGT1_9LAMI